MGSRQCALIRQNPAVSVLVKLEDAAQGDVHVYVWSFSVILNQWME